MYGNVTFVQLIHTNKKFRKSHEKTAVYWLKPNLHQPIKLVSFLEETVALCEQIIMVKRFKWCP
jgi:hypothetical protein